MFLVQIGVGHVTLLMFIWRLWCRDGVCPISLKFYLHWFSTSVSVNNDHVVWWTHLSAPYLLWWAACIFTVLLWGAGCTWESDSWTCPCAYDLLTTSGWPLLTLLQILVSSSLKRDLGRLMSLSTLPGSASRRHGASQNCSFVHFGSGQSFFIEYMRLNS